MILQQFERALGVFGIQVAGRFVCQDQFRIVSESAGDRHALLFAAGEMTARLRSLSPRAHRPQ